MFPNPLAQTLAQIMVFAGCFTTLWMYLSWYLSSSFLLLTLLYFLPLIVSNSDSSVKRHFDHILEFHFIYFLANLSLVSFILFVSKGFLVATKLGILRSTSKTLLIVRVEMFFKLNLIFKSLLVIIGFFSIAFFILQMSTFVNCFGQPEPLFVIVHV